MIRWSSIFRTMLSVYIVYANPTTMGDSDSDSPELGGQSILSKTNDEGDEESTEDASDEDEKRRPKHRADVNRPYKSHEDRYPSYQTNNEPNSGFHAMSSLHSSVSQDRFPSSFRQADDVSFEQVPSPYVKDNDVEHSLKNRRQKRLSTYSNNDVRTQMKHLTLHDGETESLYSSLVSEDACTAPSRYRVQPQKQPQKCMVDNDGKKVSDDKSYDDQKEKMRSFHQTPTKSMDEKTRKSSLKTHDDIEDFIREFVKKDMKLGVNHIKFFDAAVVYDRRDYDHVKLFVEEVKGVVENTIGEEIRIELFDSMEFAQSMIMVVEDVIDRCSVVFVYLTENCTEETIKLFCDEGIGITRLQLGSSDSPWENERKWVLKPVHTQPLKRRRYRTPVGLVSLQGINWYDKESSHTKDRLIHVMKHAMQQRKRRENETNTKLDYQRNEKERFSYSKQPLKYPAKEAPFANNSNKTKPSLVEDAESFSYLGGRQMTYQQAPIPTSMDMPRSYTPQTQYMQHSMYVGGSQQTQHYYRDPYTTQYGHPHQMQQMGYPRQPYLDIYGSQQIGVNGYQNFAPITPQGMVYPSQNLQSYPQISQMSLNTRQPGPPIPNSFQSARIVQAPPYTPAPQQYFPAHQNQQPPQLSGQLLSQDQPASSRIPLPSNTGTGTGNYMRDKRNDAPATTDLSVVSRVTGQLIVNSNLSTDDIEVDQPSGREEDSASEKTSKHSGASFKQRIIDEMSDTSSSDESDFEMPHLQDNSKRSNGKVLNFYGCENVQLGAECKVIKVQKTKSTKKRKSSPSSSKRSSASDSQDASGACMNSLKLSDEHFLEPVGTENDQTSNSTVYGDSLDLSYSYRDETETYKYTDKYSEQSNSEHAFFSDINSDLYLRRQQRRSEDVEGPIANTLQEMNVFDMKATTSLTASHIYTSNNTDYLQDNIKDNSFPENISDDELFSEGHVNENMFYDLSQSSDENVSEKELSDGDTKVYNIVAGFIFSNFKGKQHQLVKGPFYSDSFGSSGIIRTDDDID